MAVGSRGRRTAAALVAVFVVLGMLSSVAPVMATTLVIDIEKSTNGVDADTPPGPSIRIGDPVVWTYVVTNPGEQVISDVEVTDLAPEHSLNPTPVYVSGDENDNGLLDPGEAWVYQASSTAFWDEALGGSYANEAFAHGVGEYGHGVDASDPSHYVATSYCPIDGDIVVPLGSTDPWRGLLKDAPGARRTEPVAVDIPAGVWSVRLAGYDAHSVRGGGGEHEEQWAAELVSTSGATVRTPTTRDIPDDEDFVVDEVAAALVLDEAVTTLTGLHGSLVGPSNSTNSLVALCAAFTRLRPGVSIEKATNGEDADDPTGPTIAVGGAVEWTYVVTNTGSLDLTEVVVSDDQGVTPAYASGDDGDGVLEPGESWTYTASGVAVAGQYVNVATVEAVAVGGEQVSASDRSHYFGAVPAIDIVKSTVGDGSTVVGGSVTFELVVTNTGNVPLSEVTVTDPLVPACDAEIGDLAVGASVDYTCVAEGITAGFTNVAHVVGTSPLGERVAARDEAPVRVVAASGLIGDTVWHDVNKNGKQDPGEEGVAGAKVKLTNLDTNETATATTNADGKYLFSGLAAGRYRVELVTSSVSGDLTTPRVFTPVLGEGAQSLDNDFGLAEALPRTGLDAGALAFAGVVLVLGGGALLVVDRRRLLGR